MFAQSLLVILKGYKRNKREKERQREKDHFYLIKHISFHKHTVRKETNVY